MLLSGSLKKHMVCVAYSIRKKNLLIYDCNLNIRKMYMTRYEIEDDKHVIFFFFSCSTLVT